MCNGEQRRSWILVAWLGVLLSSCGGSTGHSGDSETHFLSYCDGSCSDGFSCVCGVCTKTCDEAGTCRHVSDAARCVAPTSASCESSAPELVCDVQCDASRDCASLGDGYSCDGGACRQGTPPSSTPQAGAGGTGSGGTGSGGTGTGGAAEGGAGAAVTCYAALDGDPVDLEAVPLPSSYAPEFVLTEDGFVGVGPGADSLGYAIVQYDGGGTLQGSVQTLWPDTQSTLEPHLAVSGDVLAIVDLDVDEGTQRQVCRLALAQLGDLTSIRPPTRYGDAPTPDSVLNESDACGLVAVDDGFVVLWDAFTSDESLESTLFAQGLDRGGNMVGERLTLAIGDKRTGMFSAASDGSRAVVAVAGTQDAALELAFIEDGELSTRPLDPKVSGSSDVVELEPAHDGFIARAGDSLSMLDRDGGLLHGPVAVDSSASVATLDAGYVVVAKEEYLVARTLDAELGAPSAPTGIGDSRSASVSQLLYEPDGSRVGLIYSGSYVGLKCSQTPPAALGPSVCPAQSEVSPLDDGCMDRVCHVMVRLDYLTLGLRGWAVIGADVSPVDSEAALTRAQTVFDENSEYVSSPSAQGPQAGLFTVVAEPSDFGAFALVGEQSGLVVAAGGVVWSGRGSYWVPSEWNDPSGLACGAEAAEAAETYLHSGECASEDVTPATAAEALDMVLRSNLVAHLAEQGPFSAHAFLYTPSVGACDPGIAEYLVVLTQER